MRSQMWGVECNRKMKWGEATGALKGEGADKYRFENETEAIFFRPHYNDENNTVEAACVVNGEGEDVWLSEWFAVDVREYNAWHNHYL